MVAVWIALLWPPLPVGAPSPLAAFSLLLVPSFLSLPNQPANILNGALVVIEILWLATVYPSLQVSGAETQPLAA